MTWLLSALAAVSLEPFETRGVPARTIEALDPKTAFSRRSIGVVHLSRADAHRQGDVVSGEKGVCLLKRIPRTDDTAHEW
jgi:hypothetical protein